MLGYRMARTEAERGLEVLDEAIEAAIWAADPAVIAECQLWKTRAQIEAGEGEKARPMLGRLQSDAKREGMDLTLDQVAEEMERLDPEDQG